MPEENVEVVRRLIEMNRSGDLDAAAEAMEAVTRPDGEYPRLSVADDRTAFHPKERFARLIVFQGPR